MRVYSFAFFRHNASAYESPRCGEAQGRFFINYIRAIVRAHWAVFPDWEMRIHHDDRVTQYPYWRAMERMHSRGLFKLVYMGVAHTLCGSMLWRMEPIWEDGVSEVLCRDVDSLQTPRERRAVERWLGLGLPVSALHDSQSHSCTALMGGMVGFTAGFVRSRWPSLENLVAQAAVKGIDLNQHGADQALLNTVVAPAARSAGIMSEDRDTLGPRDHPIDQLTAHIGGAYHVDPVVKFFDENPQYCPRLSEIKECENG